MLGERREVGPIWSDDEGRSVVIGITAITDIKLLRSSLDLDD